jgi:hypothetical protein
MELGINNLPDKLTIDYGTGTCDRVATISYKGQTATITF